jgi:hypothetical protein
MTADSALGIARHNAEPQLRLEIDPLGVDLKPGVQPIKARIVNVGDVPAMRVEATGDWEPVHAQPLSELWAKIPIKSVHDVVRPGEKVDVVILRPVTLTEADVAAIKNGQKLAIHVYCGRDDIFGPGHERVWKHFERWYDRATGDWYRGYPGSGGPLSDTD